MITLFKTLFGIILFRKGPADIPHSPLLLRVVAAMWLLTGVAALVLIESYSTADFLINLIVAAAVLGIYALVINVFQKRERMVRAFTAILGCSAILVAVSMVAQLLLPGLFEERQILMFVFLLIVWSILIDAHIIVRTIDGDWILGFLIAMAAFIAQLQLEILLTPLFNSTT